MTNIRIHNILPKSRANGPGIRFCIWVQGCTLGCPNCHNPATHNLDSGTEVSIKNLYDKISSLVGEIDGISISGGEPLQQPTAVIELLTLVKNKLNLSTILWTGYSPKELEKMHLLETLKEIVDVIVSGRYIDKLRIAKGLRGSNNKKYIINSNLYTIDDLDNIPVTELIFSDEGIVITGINPEYVKGWFQNE